LKTRVLLPLALLFLPAALAHAATVVISGVAVHPPEKGKAYLRRAQGVQVGFYARGSKDAYVVDTTSEDGVFNLVAYNVFTEVVYVRYEGDRYEAAPVEVRLARGPGRLIQAKCRDLVLRPRNPDLRAAGVQEIAAHLATVADALAFEARIGLTNRKTANEAILQEFLRVASSVGPAFQTAEILAEVRRLSQYAQESLPLLGEARVINRAEPGGAPKAFYLRRGPRPLTLLRFPPVPEEALGSLSGETVVCKVTVEKDGTVSADCADNPPSIPRFLLRETEEMLEEAEWQRAMNEHGPVSGRMTVQFTWK
jgi:hypothetical protein